MGRTLVCRVAQHHPGADAARATAAAGTPSAMAGSLLATHLADDPGTLSEIIQDAHAHLDDITAAKGKGKAAPGRAEPYETGGSHRDVVGAAVVAEMVAADAQGLRQLDV